MKSDNNNENELSPPADNNDNNQVVNDESSDSDEDEVDINELDIVLDQTDEVSQGISHQQKLKKLREEVRRLQKERDNYLTQLQRERADSINLRKAEEEKRKGVRQTITIEVIRDLIPSLDSFDAAMNNKELWQAVDKNWRIGVEYIYQQLLGVLENYGVRIDNPVGEKFDPVRHEPHSYKEVSDKKEEGKILEILQKGYYLGEIAIRPTRVTVGKLPNDKEK